MTPTTDVDYSSGLDPEAEYPLAEPKPVPLYSEAFSFEAYDGVRGIGFWAYLNVPSFDFGLAREILAVFLPDHRVLLAKAFGRGRTRTAQAGANLSFECIEPFRHWRLRYAAPVLVRTQHQTLEAPITDGIYDPIKLGIEVYGSAPVWIAGSRDAAAAKQAQRLAGADTHYNQIVTVNGRLEFEDSVLEFTGTGVRDHTRGPRQVRGTFGHQFVFCTFPSGRSFGVFCSQPKEGESLGQGYVVVDGVVHHADTIEVTPFTGFGPLGERVSVGFRTDLGVASIQGVTLTAVGFTMLAPNEVVLGADRTNPESYFIIDSHARLTWDGETSIGVFRRGTVNDPGRWSDAPRAR